MDSTLGSNLDGSIPRQSLMYLYHHVFLPPRVPQEDDQSWKHDEILLQVVIRALEDFRLLVNAEHTCVVRHVTTTIARILAVRGPADLGGSVTEQSLTCELADLVEKGGSLPLHIQAQNAGVLVTRTDEHFRVEAFEISPCNEAIISTKGRLARVFPGSAVSIPKDVFCDPAFLATVADTLAKMSCQSASGSKRKVKKAGKCHDEERDTVHPKIVTELFMAFLASIGNPINVQRVWKNTRDEVAWLDCLSPWRRSPLWMLIRAVMHLEFLRLTSAHESPEELYKLFMIFLMSQVIGMAQQQELRSDILYTMTAKVNRRLHKLRSAVNPQMLSPIQNVLQKIEAVLNTRMAHLVTNSGPLHDFSCLSTLEFHNDTVFHLPILDDYLQSVMTRTDARDFTEFKPSPNLSKCHTDKLPSISKSVKTDYLAYNLMALESWVAAELPSWLVRHNRETATCGNLCNLLHDYHDVASPFYSGNPEAVSTMLLTITELWIACDQTATGTCDLLCDYDPEVPVELLQSLILPAKPDMQRLTGIEDYLSQRRSRAKYPSTYIYGEFDHRNSFGVRYFEQSAEHKTLMRDIEYHAMRLRSEKTDEYYRKKAQYHFLIQRSDGMGCDFEEVITDHFNDFRERRHLLHCRKCSCLSEAAGITIAIHEWPLPKNVLQAQSTVFELRVPQAVGHWRDTTVFYLIDVLKSRYVSIQKPRAMHPLATYCGLSAFFQPSSPAQRVSLLSQNKPHEVTHRKTKSISTAAKEDVCLDNGMYYQFYDSFAKCFMHEIVTTEEIPLVTTYKQPERASSIQQFMFRPSSTPGGPPPNAVIASQADCPDEMSLEEFKALSSISLGYRVQWQNVLVQLVNPSVDFRKMETTVMVLQAACQAGPPCHHLFRASHLILTEDAFGMALLESLQAALERVKENWDSSQALSTFIVLAKRLLTLTSSQTIIEACLTYLDSARRIAFGWMKLLIDKAHGATDDAQRELGSKAVESALLCADAIGVDKPYRLRILDMDENFSMLTQCSIFIYESTRGRASSLDYTSRLLYRRWQLLLYCSYPALARKTLAGQGDALSDAVGKSWAAYEPGHSWTRYSEHIDYWLITRTGSGSNTSMEVQLNLITGELLANGLPLSRLPATYIAHPTYGLIFRDYVSIEVMPSAVPGMQFSGKRDLAGHTIHFGMASREHCCGEQENDLLLQSIKGDQEWELIPYRILHGEVPTYFVDTYFHWYDRINGFLEFRPRSNPWHSSTDYWRLVKVDSEWHLTQPGSALVSPRSQSATVLHGIMSPLEESGYIHLLWQESSRCLQIALPKLQLDFHLHSGAKTIYSKQFRGQCVDANQSLGSLLGLSNRLLLRNEQGQRLVLLPEGPVQTLKYDDHVQIIIDTKVSTKAQSYVVDDEIGRLLDNGALKSKLFLCHLHALTSFCLPDPLTGMTGTESALSILKSASVGSFPRLGSDDILLLDTIAKLTAERVYYPANETVMETVHWSAELSFLTQHNHFYQSVKSILEQAERSRMFNCEGHIQPRALPKIEKDLFDRDCIRNATFRVSGFGAEDFTTQHDFIYPARDQNQTSSSGSKALVMSYIVHHKRRNPHFEIPNDLEDRLWSYLLHTACIFGPQQAISADELRYDASLLSESAKYLQQYWTPLQRLLSCSRTLNKFDVMMWISTLAFADSGNMDVIQTLAMTYSVAEMSQLAAPTAIHFQLSAGRHAVKSELDKAVRSALLSFKQSPEATLPRHHDESKKAHKNRQQTQFRNRQDQAIDDFVDSLVVQWPCECPSSPSKQERHEQYIDSTKALHASRSKFHTWFKNDQLYRFLAQTKRILFQQQPIEVCVPWRSFSLPLRDLHGRRGYLSCQDILAFPAPDIRSDIPALNDLVVEKTVLMECDKSLISLAESLRVQAKSRFQQKYAIRFGESVHALQSQKTECILRPGLSHLGHLLSNYLHDWDRHVRSVYDAMVATILSAGPDLREPVSHPSIWIWVMAASVMHRPRLCPTFYLKHLRSSEWPSVPEGWKRCLIRYGLAITKLQQAKRLVKLASNPSELVIELRNVGHTNWNAEEYPDSLLLEIDSGNLIREIQEDIARHMRKPESDRNSTFQLNMGEGKSSMIVPMVASALADTSRLVRVVVAKSHSKQMFQMLLSKIGGLLNRRIYHMPFSRSLRLNKSDAQTVIDMCRECMASRGILLVQPEHILSFKLMGIESLLTGKEKIGRKLLEAQNFFDTHSRDIVDESDENFNVKFELVYTMGLQQPVDHSPDRWFCIHQILTLVMDIMPDAKKRFPLSIDLYQPWPAAFPRTRVLRHDAQRYILDRVANRICETGIGGFFVAQLSTSVKQAIFTFMTKAELTPDELSCIESQRCTGLWDDGRRQTLLLLRGLLAGGILAFALGQKRWRVNYGLDASRRPQTKLAVPYRAKDTPSLRSEFSHPDVVIVLTSLCYYYEGMTDENMFQCFQYLCRSDQADAEYQLWIQHAPTLPRALKNLTGINLKDRTLCTRRLFPPLRHVKCVIDFFLGRVVFPKQMREFPKKLSGSGWDLARVKTHPTTGFSGTNDSQETLPLSMHQIDLPAQQHTNALVLNHLLQPRNTVAALPRREHSTQSDAELLLSIVTAMEPPVRVVLDVGAQILELSNQEVAHTWLRMVPNAGDPQAVVFFDEYDNLQVLDRAGHIEPLQISSFNQQLDLCLIYLDQAHTRGTDLKLPASYRAALTLGASLTKDTLVQACMRMRKLATTQSVVFCVPQDIQDSILRYVSRDKQDCADVIEVIDIIQWTVSETWKEIQRQIPLWAVQGERFENQNAIRGNNSSCINATLSKDQAERFLEKESQTLTNRYWPVSRTRDLRNLTHPRSAITDLIHERCQEFNDFGPTLANLQEEQERELSPEIEEERQREKPARVEPARHHVHADLRTFVETGDPVRGSAAYQPAFETLRSTSAATHLDVSQFPADLLVSTDYARTVLPLGASDLVDAYQRPVQFVVTSASIPTSSSPMVQYMMIISPFEAEHLQSAIRGSERVTLHLYAPRPNRSFRALDRLDLYNIPVRPWDLFIPPTLKIQLNLFSGQLYLNSFEEYVEVCNFLGLAWHAKDDDFHVAADGFILLRKGIPVKSGFACSPVQFLKVLMTKIRRNCEDIGGSHLGKLLAGRLLHSVDFEEVDD